MPTKRICFDIYETLIKLVGNMRKFDDEIDLLSELDNVSQIHFPDQKDVDDLMIQMGRQVSKALRIERINVWLFNKEKSAIISVGEYDRRDESFKKNSILRTADFPLYFNAIQRNKIIHAPEINEHPYTREFKEVYSDPYNIKSLLDIPLRISGELVGVMCFEKTEIQKIFTEKEIQFCLSISFLVASNFEAYYRRALQVKLEKYLKEKEILLEEVNHRVKNNFAILISLMHLSYEKANSEETKQLLHDYEQRLFSMLKIHDLLNSQNGFKEINLVDYLKSITNEFVSSYPEFSNKLKVEIDVLEISFSTKKAIHLGLIVTEILLNIAKHCSALQPNFKVLFSLQALENRKVLLQIGDNGKGFDFIEELNKDSLGLSIIKNLVETLEIGATFPTIGNCYYALFIDY